MSTKIYQQRFTLSGVVTLALLGVVLLAIAELFQVLIYSTTTIQVDLLRSKLQAEPQTRFEPQVQAEIRHLNKVIRNYQEANHTWYMGPFIDDRWATVKPLLQR
jgi:hypothetical protein